MILQKLQKIVTLGQSNLFTTTGNISTKMLFKYSAKVKKKFVIYYNPRRHVSIERQKNPYLGKINSLRKFVNILYALFAMQYQNHVLLNGRFSTKYDPRLYKSVKYLRRVFIFSTSAG